MSNSDEMDLGEAQQDQISLTYNKPGEIEDSQLQNVYNTLLNQFNRISAMLGNEEMRQQFIQANLPDVQALGERIQRLQDIDLSSSREYIEALREGIRQLQDFLHKSISTKPIYAQYLVDSAFWMYFPLTLQELELVTGEIDTIFPANVDKNQIKNFLDVRLNATNDYLQNLIQAMNQARQNNPSKQEQQKAVTEAIEQQYNARLENLNPFQSAKELFKLTYLLVDAINYQYFKPTIKNGKEDLPFYSIYFLRQEGRSTYFEGQDTPQMAVQINNENNFLLLPYNAYQQTVS